MPVTAAPPPRTVSGYKQWVPDVRLGLQNLLAHRLRSMLTMLGMIFGVAAVVSMLSIGAGARQRVMAFIEQMGVRNLIVEAKETTEWQAHQKIRKISPGLTLQDYRILEDDIDDILLSTPRKRFTPSKTLPKSQQDPPAVYGVNGNYPRIAGLGNSRAVLHCRRGEICQGGLRFGRRCEIEPVWCGQRSRRVRKAKSTMVPGDRGSDSATQLSNRSGWSTEPGLE